MESSGKSREQADSRITRALLSDAGAWLARMNGPLRTPATEEGFRRWLNEHPLHREAFRLLTEDWEEIGELKRFARVDIGAPRFEHAREVRTPRLRPMLAAAAVLVVAVIGLLSYSLQHPSIATGVGEQRTLTLEDGTKVSLNTSTRIAVQYDKSQRGVRLEAGEAFFEVAKHSNWPFVVTVGGNKVTALGTAFVVRKDAGRRVAITLMEGKVAVTGVPDTELSVHGTSSSLPSERQSTDPSGDRTVTLAPGERLILAEREQPLIDRPALDKVTAWQQGRVAIDNMRLSEAVAEMNRYSTLRLVIERPESERLVLSGVFTAGQSESFARAVAQSYGLEVVRQGDAIVLAGLPGTPH